ncbi:hypothetical protein BU23DRAFT_625395 [Bimuria novae-zelandiae CBS 107.79]|uniref:Zinc finger PHD-type domain-containing protein n=1 Tax=Bimuria novae-zelandiae CBS 107.79 TaxID=1447943 RepID=A0A6A5VSB2_9PLEO|nr:hypothetical protein BU23DRAFT_625395 [Bimuria novae-zelandiae CBS 107.79]
MLVYATFASVFQPARSESQEAAATALKYTQGFNDSRPARKMSSSRVTWESVNGHTKTESRTNNTINDTMNRRAGEKGFAGFDSELRTDLNNQLHVDASASEVYHVGDSHDTRHYSAAAGGHRAMKAMRDHLKFLLPKELIQDEYGISVPVEAVSSQHLAKLQAMVWRELPAIVARNFTRFEGVTTEQDLIAARSVYWLSECISRNNTVFVLRPRSTQPCHIALCEHIHKTAAPSFSRYEVMVEPLVDWMTLEPVPDVTSIWFIVYRRNRKLLDKFALSNNKFIPRNPPRFCFECLTYLADERNWIWRIIQKNPNTLGAEVSLPQLEPEDGTNAEMSEEAFSDNGSTSSTSGYSAAPVTPNAARISMISSLDGAFDGWRKASPRKFEIWHDPTSDDEHGVPVLAPCHGPYTLPRPVVSPRFTSPQLQRNFTPFRHTVESADHMTDQQPTRVAGWTPINTGHSTLAPQNGADLESAITILPVDGQDERRFGDELDPNTDMVEPMLNTSWSDLPTKLETPATPPLEPVISLPQTPRNAFKQGGFRWPTPKDSTAPIPARPAPGSDVTPKYLFPRPNQLICSCKKPAKTGTTRVVQCRNPNCFIGWYHYACLNLSEKGCARFGTLLCELCTGEQHWRKKADGTPDLSILFSKEELLQGVYGILEGVGAKDPYGLCMFNWQQESGDSDGYLGEDEAYGVVYHEDEDEPQKKKQKMAHEDIAVETDVHKIIEVVDEDIEGETIGSSDEETEEEDMLGD